MTRFAIANNRVTLIALLVILIGGAQAYLGMPRSEDPGFIIRVAQVVSIFPGASPERVEQLVTDKLEQKIMEMPELDFVKSQSKTGISIVIVNIREEFKQMRPIWDTLRRKVEAVRPELPDGVVSVEVNDEFGDVFGIVVGLTGDGYSFKELHEVAKSVRRSLLRGSEVAKVEIHGVQDERIFIEFNSARLSRLGLSPGYLIAALQARNIVIPGGSISHGAERFAIEPSGNLENIDELRRTLIRLPRSGETVYLEDIVDVRRAYKDPPSHGTRLNGEPALALAISMKAGGNLIQLGEDTKRVLEDAEAALPLGLNFELVSFQPQIVEQKIDDFVSNLVQAIAIVMGVMLITLGVRTGLVVATLIPSAIIMAVLVMDVFGIGLNQISLAALIIALGMLVDNAIVMSENVMVLLSEGVPRVEAAVQSANELKIPLLTSSLTTSAAFLPIYLAESAVGEYTGALFTVVTITLMCSWLLALTVIPLLCVMFLKVEVKTGEETMGPMARLYRSMLTTSMRYRYLTVLLAIGVFVVAMMGFGYVPKMFFPSSDRPMMSLTLELPKGAPIEETSKVVDDFERFIDASLRVKPSAELAELGGDSDGPGGSLTWASFIGRGAPRFTLSYAPDPGSPNYAYLMINTTDRAVIDVLSEKLRDYGAEHHPNVSVIARPMVKGPVVPAPVEYKLSSDDPRLFAFAKRVQTQLGQTAGTISVSDNWGRRAKKLVVRVDEERARKAGFTREDIAISLNASLSGLAASEYREGDSSIPIVLRSIAADRHDLGKLESLNIFGRSAPGTVPLKQVADVEMVWEPPVVHRRDQVRTVTVSCFLEEGVTAVEINAIMQPWIEAEMAKLGPGFTLKLGGDVDAAVKGNESIGAKMPIAFMAILLLLVAQFNSVRRPLIILLTIPMGMIGVVIGLLVADSYFGFMTLLGVVSLSGIVINNAIVLLDRINIEVEENGLSQWDAVITAALRRVRPILLTTATTVGGLIPLWLGGGPMFEPMAIAILFGLLFATVLTLGLVPVLYSIFFRAVAPPRSA